MADNENLNFEDKNQIADTQKDVTQDVAPNEVGVENVVEADTNTESALVETEQTAPLETERAEADPVEVALADSEQERLDNKKNVADDNSVKSDRKKKNKKPMSKRNKIIIATACATLAAVVLGLVIWLLVVLFGPSATQAVSTVSLKVDMGDEWYVGGENQYDLKNLFTNGSDFKQDGNTLTFKQGGKTISKKIIKIDNAVNVNNFEELVSNINEGKEVVVQVASLKAPKLEGKKEEQIPQMFVKNNVYGNGAKVNVREIVGTRLMSAKKNGGKLAPLTDGTNYKKGKYEEGRSAFTIVPNGDKKVIFRDMYVSGCDMSTAEGGDIAGLTEEVIEDRGVKLFSGYGSMLYALGNDEDGKANATVEHCVFENGGKVVHVQNANVDINGCIIRNASDTAVSICTEANHASVVNMKDNVIVNSLTGGILFYCYDTSINESNAKNTWNTLNIYGFLDIYNWKSQDNLAFLPETESPLLANIANSVASEEIKNKQYNNLKAKVGMEHYIHFAIIKIRTGGTEGGDVAVNKNGSTVNFVDEQAKRIGFTDSKQNNLKDGFPIPGIAASIMKDIDVWGYYGKEDGAVKPNASFETINLDKLYKELRNGRN